jgi:glycosyltransferase involved in cell wall biosynthesis
MNWVVFSGTHYRAQGLEQLITAWRRAKLADWELHLAGQGEMTVTLEKMAEGDRSIVFHGLLNRQENASLLAKSRIGIVPCDPAKTPGSVFPFKAIECLAAGVHVITTPMGAVEPEMARGMTVMPDNSPETIAASLKQVIDSRAYDCHAEDSAVECYGPPAVANSLHDLFLQASRIRSHPGRVSAI